MLRCWITATILLGSTLAIAGSAYADCIRSDVQFVFQGDTVITSGTVTDGSPCLTYYGAGPMVEYTSVTVLDPPKHGTVRNITQFRRSYVPKPGYRGPERFSYKVCARTLHGDGCTIEIFALDIL